MKGTKKRIFWIALSVLIILSLLPVGVKGAETDVAKILNDAYALGNRETLSYEATLTGKITSVETPYNSNYKNISVIIEVPGYVDKPMLCYRLKGDGADQLVVGDIITVTGTITNYYGTIEYTAGCALEKVVKCECEILIAEGTATYDTYIDAWDPEGITFIPAEDGAVIVNIAACTPGFYLDVYQDGELFREYSNPEAWNITIPVSAGAEYEFLIGSAVVSSPTTCAPNPGSVTYMITSNVPAGEKWEEVQPTCTKVYCQVLDSWTQCYIYTWDADGNAQTGSWPGSLMVKEDNGLLSYEVPATATKIIFNNGNGGTDNQTDDLTVPIDNKVKYVMDTATWEELTVGSGENDALTTPTEIVDAAYALKNGETLEGTYTLTGEIFSVDTLYDSNYKNITVTIKVQDRESKPIKCFRLAGEGANILKKGDIITVSGILTNYNGSIQFAQGCTLDGVFPGGSTDPIPDSWGPNSLALVGENIPGVSLWNPADPAGNMTEVSGNIYEIILDCPAGTSMSFKIAGNDAWDDNWNFGSASVVLGEQVDLPCGGGTGEMTLSVDKACTLQFVVDLNPMYYGGNATLLVEKLDASIGNRTLTVIAPDSWSTVYVYTWEPLYFGDFPGVVISKVDGVYKASIKASMVNLLLSGRKTDGTLQQTGDIKLEANGQNVIVTVFEDGTYSVNYGDLTMDHYCVVGNADWMGNWDVSSYAGLMTQFAPNVYQKCFKDVAPGKYEFWVTKNAIWDGAWNDNGDPFTIHVGKTCDVTVTLDLREGEGIVAVDYVRMTGDVTGDGRLNLGDVAKLYAHIRNTAALTDKTALDCADFNGDGKINIGDTARVYAYIRGTDPCAVVDAAYQLAENQEMSTDKTLTGKVLGIIEPYNAKYGCITVSMAVAGSEDHPILCSRLMGADGANISINDNITVTGRLRNFYGSVEFKEGCQLMKWENVLTPEETMAEIVDAAYTLGNNETMDHPVTLTGKVISIDQAYTAGVSYISVTIEVVGRKEKPISCYRMVGEQISMVEIGDTITVTGTLRNFYGTVEFKEGCQLENYVPGKTPVETDPQKIVDMAYALAKDTEMAYDVTLTGKVTSIKETFNSAYQNISVMIQINGRESKPILVYRMKGDGIAYIAVNDTITVTGRLKNYNGTVEMVNCTMTKRVSGGGTPVIQETEPDKILAAAQKLSDYEELPYDVTLTGKVIIINDAYNADYQNVTATISVTGAGSNLKLYRLKGDGVDQLAVNDTVTVVGRIKMYYGELELVNGTMIQRISGCGSTSMIPTDSAAIMDEAEKLATGMQLPYKAALSGKVLSIDTPYDSVYMNITFTITVDDTNGKTLLCYRVKDNGVDQICVNDRVTVTGNIMNYNGILRLVNGELTNRISGGGTVPVAPSDPKQIVDAAFALGENEVLPYFATLTGTVKSIDEPYNDMYNNIVLTMTVQGTDGPKDIVCYRLKGDQADSVAVGDTITVTGIIKRYVSDKTGIHEDYVEFNSGCILESLQH